MVFLALLSTAVAGGLLAAAATIGGVTVKTLGIDVDGPQNDKGLYALVPIHKQTTISTIA